MDGASTWDFFPAPFHGNMALVIRATPDESDNEDASASVSLDSILPDDLLKKVMSFLPIASIIRSGSVCKRWHEAVHSERCSWNYMAPQKPWYFMFTCSHDALGGYVYDPSFRKWYSFDFPPIEGNNWSASSSLGLVSLMDGERRSWVFVCNPISKDWKKLHDVPGDEYPDYSALAMSVDRRSRAYTVAVVKCKQVPHDYSQWGLSIHVYDSKTTSWITLFEEVLQGWRGGRECVICNGNLYCLVYSTTILGNMESRYCLVKYDLSARPSDSSVIQMAIPAPCPLTCIRLMNIKDRVVLVGGIGKRDRPGIIKGIGIWQLIKNEWQEIAKMPQKFFQGFGELDDVFASSGVEDLIYIQSFGSTTLLTFDMIQKVWKWSVKSPMMKRFPLQLFTGFSFEPRIETSP